MNNSLKTKEQPPKRGANAPRKRQNKTLLIDKELKTKDLRKTAAERASGPGNKSKPTDPDSLRQAALLALVSSAEPLRYGPTGDSAPRLRLKAAGMAERFPFGFAPNMNDNILYHALVTPSILRLFGKTPRSAPHGPTPPLPLVSSASFGSARSRPGREAAQRTLDGEDRSGIIHGEGKGGDCRRDHKRTFGASEPGGEIFPQHLPRRDPGAPPVDGQPRREARPLHPLDRMEGQRELPGLQEPS